ncbi:MAG: 30S ribosome-binding factor RbfA [Bacteroidetes bacterium]|nr:30S ribosome-binding factor RbfA [Bacteroidota bacterium]
MSIRIEKIANEIRRILSSELSKIASENSAGLASISTVKVSKDFSIANIYFNLLSLNKTDISAFIEILNKNKGHLRSILAHNLRIRTTPDLRFYYDDTLDIYKSTQELIENVKKKSPYSNDYGDTSVYDEKVLQKVETENTKKN